MQNITRSGISVNKGNNCNISKMNGNNNNNIYAVNSVQNAMPDNFIFEQVDPSQEEDDSDSDTFSHDQVNQGHGHGYQHAANSGLKPGKKTKGRVKIKMEFIENKLRRYTTFSKRKTGIMKKAYELSTLTGTQVMLLVASETGHVYTFATRKLQPMITSDNGKALIQTCLNSPDTPTGSTENVLEKRMNPSGFEETDLSCAVGDEDQPKMVDSNSSTKPVFPIPTPVSVIPNTANINSSLQQEQHTVVSQHHHHHQQQQQREALTPSSTHMITQMPTFALQTVPSPTTTTTTRQPAMTKTVTVNATSHNSNNNSQTNSSTPATSSFLPLIIQQGGTISMLQPTSQSFGQAISVSQSSQSHSVLKPASLSQVVSALNSHTMSSSQTSQTGELNTPLPAGTPSAINIMQGMTPGIVMYHTPQGVVYATPTQNLNDRTIFNFQQPATAISMTQADQSSGQQIITIPVPGSISGTPLIQLAPPPNAENSGESKQVQPPPAKKSKK